MIVFLFIWLLALTALVAVGFLMVIGKFARVGRGQQELVNEVLDDEGYSKIEEIHGVVEGFIAGFENLKTEVENLKTQIEILEGTPSQVDNISSQISSLIETQDRLHTMIERGYEDRPVVTAPLPVASSPTSHNNKGGRPRKGQ